MSLGGAKAKKGAKAKAARRGTGNARNNPKAFKAASGPNSMRLSAYRALERQEKQYHVALVDRSAEGALDLGLGGGRAPELREQPLRIDLLVTQRGVTGEDLLS